MGEKFPICYRFKVPGADQTAAPGTVQKERDAWVQAIDKLCSHWKRKSRSDHMFVETKTLQHLCITEEDNDTDLESSSEFGGGGIIYPPADYANANPTYSSNDNVSHGDPNESYSSAAYPRPVPTPRSPKTAVQVTGPDHLSPIQSPTSPSASVPTLPSSPPPSPSPRNAGFTSSSTGSESHESSSTVMTGPPPPAIPAPPPLPFKPKTKSRKSRTKAFHWDLVGSERVTFNFYFFHQEMIH